MLVQRISLPLFAIFAAALYAQEYRGRIQGNVTDSSQAAVAGATVTLLNINTGVSTVRQSNETGHYLFDLVQPGTYNVTAELAGFSKFQQQSVLLQARGDVTVDAVLNPGNVQETVTVTAQASAVQFNTSKLETTVDSRLVKNLPQLYRSPFLLAQLDPSVERNDSNAEYNPYSSWGANQQRVGGGANYTNDIQVDGSPVGLGYKTSYVPAPDMVQEVTVQQNAVDAEYGHSSGSAISVTLKTGTNESHGNLFYQGQYPWANAVENRVFQTTNKGRNHMFGGTLGHRIIRNKLFNFVAFEGWEKTDPNDLILTLPTELERKGDFSQSLNVMGGLRTIYDPWSTQTSADGRTVTRTPFPGNVIPQNRLDPVALSYMQKLWQPNRPGTGQYYKVNNYYAPLPVMYPYKNFSDRVDYIVNDNIRVSGRVSKFVTPVTTTNPTGSEIFQSDRGSQRDASSYAGDVTWTVSPTTVLNFHGDYHNFVDASAFTTDFSEGGGWAKVWPNSTFYNSLFSDPTIPILIPRISILGTGNERLVNMGPGGGYWDQRPNGDSINVKVAHQRGQHYLKFGVDTRGTRTTSLLQQNNPGFGFSPEGTAETYVNPDLRLSGDGYATFLLGAVQPTSGSPSGWDSGTTSMPVLITPTPQNRFYGMYLNDDWKITRDLTLNLGIRYEYEQAYRDPENRLTRPLDLSSPIPEMQGANAPQKPAELQQFYGGPWIFNGAFQFADENNRGQWNAGKGAISPRIGAAYRLNDKTSIRAAWGRYVTPWTGNGLNIFDSPYYGYTSYTGAPPAILGVPQMRLADPFPTSNPIVPSYGKSLGRYTGLGDSFTYAAEDRPRNRSDRYNFSVQRQVPGGMVVDVTYYMNFTKQVGLSYNINQVDPRIAYQYKDAVNKSVPNPFYNFGTVATFPGALRYQPQVSLTSLMRPYPQYGNLTVIDAIEGNDAKYYALQLRVQKNFSSGYSMMLGYNYHFERNQVFYDDVDTFTQTWTWQDSANPRHRLVGASTWEIPFGKGRHYFSGAPRVVDAVLGGWNLTGIFTWRSGRFLRFGGMVVDGNPILDDPTPGKWFNTAAFSRLPAYTRRQNPWQYPGLTGPGLLNVDTSLVKSFPIVERFRAELRVDSFNALNNLTWADPNTTITSSLFGTSNNQLANTFGRRTQLGLRIEF